MNKEIINTGFSSLYDAVAAINHKFHTELLFLIVIALSLVPVLLYLVKTFLLPLILKLVKKRDAKYLNIWQKYSMSNLVLYTVLAIYVMICSDIIEDSYPISKVTLNIKNKIVTTLLILGFFSLFNKLISFFIDCYKVTTKQSALKIELYIHIIRIVLLILTIVSCIFAILNINLAKLYTGLGASAAVLTLLFKDALLGLLASIQLTSQNILQVGDWVTVPKYNADGNIEKITITVVVIRNFDKTITTIPTSDLLSIEVKNWQGMFEAGGRRIKRALNLDMHTIKILSQDELNEIKTLPHMEQVSQKNPQLFDSNNYSNNLTIFRHYVTAYLEANKNIHNEGFTFLVRQLEPSDRGGIPIEIYVFTKDTSWNNYEAIQADIFDHLLAVLCQFKLQVFQSLSVAKDSS